MGSTVATQSGLGLGYVFQSRRIFVSLILLARNESVVRTKSFHTVGLHVQLDLSQFDTFLHYHLLDLKCNNYGRLYGNFDDGKVRACTTMQGLSLPNFKFTRESCVVFEFRRLKYLKKI